MSIDASAVVRHFSLQRNRKDSVQKGGLIFTKKVKCSFQGSQPKFSYYFNRRGGLKHNKSEGGRKQTSRAITIRTEKESLVGKEKQNVEPSRDFVLVPKSKTQKINIEDYFKEMTLLMIQSPKICTQFVYNTKSCVRPEFCTPTQKNRISLGQEPRLEIFQDFQLEKYADKFSQSYINHSDQLLKYDMLLVASLANKKYMLIPLNSQVSYHLILKSIAFKLTISSNLGLLDKIFFCGLLSKTDCECFFWISRPICSYERGSLSIAVKSFITKSVSVQRCRQKRIFERIYIVDSNEKLSFLELYKTALIPTCVKTCTQIENTSNHETADKNQLKITRKCISREFFANRLGPQKIFELKGENRF